MRETLVVLAFVMGPTPVAAQGAPKQETAQSDEASGEPMYRGRKIREGSRLYENEELPQKIDLRSRFEKIRDRELVKHFERMAQLDVMTEIAKGDDDERLLARIEAVRRLEVRRHQDSMRNLAMVSSRLHRSGP